MDPEVRKLLEENLVLAKANNRLLRAMRRDAWLGLFFKILVWVVLLALPLYLYQQYFAPIVAKFETLVPGSAATTTSRGPFGLPSSAEIQKLLDSYTTKH